MKRHLEGKHSAMAGYPCPMCGKALKTSNQRQVHVRKAHGLALSSADIETMRTGQAESSSDGGFT